MIEHTPGPWHIEPSFPRWAGEVSSDVYPPKDLPMGSRIPVAQNLYPNDARLIAAAPDMYALLRDVVALLNNPDADQFDADKVERRILDVLSKVEAA
jgi:hypothetical protein